MMNKDEYKGLATTIGTSTRRRSHWSL